MKMIRKFLLIMLLSYSTPQASFAAGPYLHMYLAQQLWPTLASIGKHKPEAESLFLAGNLFPDIRYLGSIDRTETHFNKVLIKDLLDKDVFQAGVKLHSYIDLAREDLAVRFHIYDYMAIVPRTYHASALKILEDVILFEQQKLSFSPFPNVGLPEERKYTKIPAENFVKWHGIMNAYLENPLAFSKTPQAAGLFGGKLDPKMHQKLIAWIEKAKGEKIFLSYVEAQKAMFALAFSTISTLSAENL